MSERIGTLDSLRGIAALAVMTQHVLSVMARHPSASEIFSHFVFQINREYFSPGQFGVILFFLISGYVVPFSLLGPYAGLRFMISRFFRLYPLYWISVGLSVVIYTLTTGRAPSISIILANLTMVQKLFGVADINPAYWTLFVELVFYGLAFVLFVTGGLYRASVLAILIVGFPLAALASAILRKTGIFTGAPVSYFIFLAVMLLGTYLRRERDSGFGLRSGTIMLATALVAFSTASFWIAFGDSTHIASWKAEVTGLCLGLVVFVHFLFRGGLTHPWLLHLGAISYSVYLIHDAPLQLAKSFAPSLPFGIFLIPVFVVSVSLILATLTYRWIERPAVVLGKYLIALVTSNRRSASSAGAV